MMEPQNKIRKRPRPPSVNRFSIASFASMSIIQRSVVEPGILPGYLGNLTEAQEAKLRALWAIGFKFVEICEADEDASRQKSREEKYVPLAKKPAYQPKAQSKTGATHEKHPTLVKELLSLLPTDETDLQKLARQAVDALDHWTPEMYHLIVTHIVKSEHPDALALRFLRACKWDLIQATKMMGKTIYWRTMEAAVDEDIMRRGEGGAIEYEKNGFGLARNVSSDFIKQIRQGKAYIHGTDRAGRPISYIRVRLHKASDQCLQSLERYTIYLLELARLALKAPVETVTLLIDMTGVGSSNIDLAPLKFLIKCVQANYPESLGLMLIHNAPLGFKTMWRVIRFWLDPVVVSKVHFTRGKRGLRRWIAEDQLLKELGGKEDWQYEYEEPEPDENSKMDDAETRDRLMGERSVLAHQFEELTKEWVMNAQLSGKALEITRRRDQVAEDLAANYWELDPYVRARSIYDRQGYFRGAEGVDWYKTAGPNPIELAVIGEETIEEEIEETPTEETLIEEKPTAMASIAEEPIEEEPLAMARTENESIPEEPTGEAPIEELKRLHKRTMSDGISTLRRASMSDEMSTVGRSSTMDDDVSSLDEGSMVDFSRVSVFKEAADKCVVNDYVPDDYVEGVTADDSSSYYGDVEVSVEPLRIS